MKIDQRIGEQDERAEPLPLGERAGDECGRDGREHQLEPGEEDERDRRRIHGAGLEADVHESREVETADETPAVDVRPEREAEPDQDPDDADDREPEEAVHDRRENVLAPHEPAVEEGEPRQHHHHKGGGHQQPGGVATVRDRRVLGRGGDARHCRDKSARNESPTQSTSHMHPPNPAVVPRLRVGRSPVAPRVGVGSNANR